MRVFEYGSGGSTVFFTRRAAHLVSVEHDRGWFERVERRLREAGISNCTQLLRPPEEGTDERFESTDPSFAGMHFGAYVRTIDDFEDEFFDLVLVDGRARPACAERAVAKVKSGGHLLLDDTFRDEYRSAFEALASYPRLDLAGISPYNSQLGQTSVWQITT
jgi:predicted O-methyltransferase YrrM